MNENGEPMIAPGDIPPAFVGGWELTALIVLGLVVSCLFLAAFVFGLFL